MKLIFPAVISVEKFPMRQTSALPACFTAKSFENSSKFKVLSSQQNPNCER